MSISSRQAASQRVLNQRVLIQEVEESQQKEGKLVKVDGERNPLGTGRIVARADDVKSGVQVGDSVIFDRRQALPLKLPDGDYLLVHESMLYVVLTHR